MKLTRKGKLEDIRFELSVIERKTADIVLTAVKEGRVSTIEADIFDKNGWLPQDALNMLSDTEHYEKLELLADKYWELGLQAIFLDKAC